TAAPLLQAQDSSLGQVIENKRIVELPLNGRNPFALGLLAGGVTQFSGLTTNLPFTAGGGRHSGNDVLLDGVDDNIRNFRGSSGRNGITYIPSVDAVQEFKVKTNNFAAEYGRSAGYTVNATIKSGTNEYHGSVFEFLRNDKLDANNFVSNFAGRPKAKFRQNQFGGTFGGPVILPKYNGRNRTFLFTDYQGTRVRAAAGSSLSDVAPASFRQGDFSRSERRIYDPATRILGANGIVTAELFSNNTIPRSRMDPISLKIQDLIPMPNVGGPESISRNFISVSPRATNWDQGDLKVDHRLWQANNLTVRFSMSQQSEPNQGAYIYSPTERLFNVRNGALVDTHIFSPTVVNEFRFGFNRANSSLVALRSDEAVAFAAENRLQSGPVIGFPAINFTFSGESFGQTQFSGFSAAESDLIFETNFHWADSVTIIRGSHSLKAGGEARRLRFDRYRGFPMNGNYYFGAVLTANPSITQQTGIPYAEFLLGIPTQVTGQNQIDWARQRDLYVGGFIQDDWKVTPKLTFNLGFRYDLYTQPVDARDRGGVFDPNLRSPQGRFGGLRRPGQDGNTRAVVQGDHDNLAPRLGFAYQMTPKFVARGGYGI
ncbi:MAG: TonB-dependent receptor domain-containing protein, partial [Bryobacteraceae bacterium]